MRQKQQQPPGPAHAFLGRRLPRPPSARLLWLWCPGGCPGLRVLPLPDADLRRLGPGLPSEPQPGPCLSPPALALLAPAVLSPLLPCCRNPLLSSIGACEFHEPRPARGCTCGPVAVSSCLWKGQDGGFAREAACESAESPLSSRKRLRTG